MVSHHLPCIAATVLLSLALLCQSVEVYFDFAAPLSSPCLPHMLFALWEVFLEVKLKMTKVYGKGIQRSEALALDDRLQSIHAR